MELSKYEKETIINFNELEEKAEIYTCDKKIMKRLNYCCKNYPQQYKLLKQDKDSKTYLVEKNVIRNKFID